MDMKKFYFILLLLCAFGLNAQERYLDASFGVEVQNNLVYGSNISVISGGPMAQDLLFDLYTPIGDTETSRPVILVAHTGSFLPALFNGSVTGSRSDSTTVSICRELASRGYIAIAYTYRQGWLPGSEDQNTRTATLLQAAYRGIQDTRSCIRYIRKSVAEDGNPYGIDPDKVGIVGVGTGSYLAWGVGALYEYDELLVEKFINTETGLSYIDTTLLGNVFGDTNAAICLANTPGYSSDVDFAFSLGGACGDITWIDGEDQEPAFSGVHCTQDVFAPYGNGPVIVPTTMEFVVNVSGNRTAVEYASGLGNNDVLNDPDSYIAFEEIIEAQKGKTVNPALSAEIAMGTDHFYGFNLPNPQGSPWSWWDFATLEVVVAATNDATGASLDAALLHGSGLITNPDMSAEKGHAYVDTIITFMAPRACLALGLNCALPVDVIEIDAETIGLEIYPNPVNAEFTIITEDATIEKVYIYSIDGRLVQGRTNLSGNQVTINRNELSSGLYIAQITTDKGVISKEIVFK